MYRVFVTSVFGIILSVAWCSGQANYTQTDSLIFEQYCETFSSKKNLPVSELMVESALFFCDSPYVGQTLDIPVKKETLIINLREFDCTTLVENCLALSLTLKSGDVSFKNFSEYLRKIRYRGGVIDGYTSRLHYSSDWMFEKEKDGFLNNISELTGGQKINKNISFMSTHSSLYPYLKNNPEEIKKIKNIEEKLNKRGGWYVINKRDILNTNEKIRNGDIILFSTTISGLDFSHMGIAYKKDGRVTFIHASSKAKKVTIEKHNLSQYCTNSTKCNGIVLLRINGLKK